MSFVQSLQNNPALFIAVVALMSLMIGSFLNVVIHRMPKIIDRQWRAEVAEASGQPLPDEAAYNLMVPRSQCPSCGHAITALENVPVISYLVLRGRCAGCRSPISLRYPCVELLTGCLSAVVAWNFGFTWTTAAGLLFVWAMIALAFIDLDSFYLPDDITLPLLWAGLLVNMGGAFVDLQTAVIGAVAGYLSLWLVYWAFKFATGKEGMGYGDFKLLAAIGAWLGWKMLPVVIMMSSLVGAVIGIGLIALARHERSKPIPFGPYLVLGGLIALFRGEAIVKYYLQTL